MGKSTISMAIFNSFLYVYQRVDICTYPVWIFQPVMFQSFFQWFFHIAMDQVRGAQNLHFTIESVGNPEGPLGYFFVVFVCY